MKATTENKELFTAGKWYAKGCEVFKPCTKADVFDNGEVKIAVCYTTFEGNSFEYKDNNPEISKIFEDNPLLMEKVITSKQAEGNASLIAESKNMYYALKGICEKLENMSLWDKTDTHYYQAKEILRKINKQ